MVRRVVYVVCAEGEEAQAELLADPLEIAGYEVAHNGTIAVGESLIGEAEKAITSGSPVVLCATAKAVGSTWAHRITNAAHGSGRVFVVQMERQAHVEQLALGGKIARYCDDPVRAIDELIKALKKNFPPILAADRQSEAIAAQGDQYLDQPTASAIFDIEALERFRAELRSEVETQYPQTLNPWDFLDRVGLRIDGQLTRAGALLFAKDPATICSTAIVKCARYYGDNRAAVREVETFEGTVPAQIIAARQFVADRVRSGEAPSADQAQSTTFYEYPMIAVREIIANALVHRDYASMDSCVHVRLFSDRLEVSSPGSWLGHDLSPGVKYKLSTLTGQSIKRNFRLAHVLSWIRLVEGEGSGIPSALRACEDMQVQEPMVVRDGNFITVALYRAEQLAASGNAADRHDIALGDLPSDSQSGSRGSATIGPQDSREPQRGLLREKPPTQRQPSRVGLWGPPQSGKSTFLSALFIATTRSAADLRVRGVNHESTEFLIRNTDTLVAQHRFPPPTLARQPLSCTVEMSVPNRARGRSRPWRRPSPPTVPFDFSIDLLDAGGREFAAVPETVHSRIDLGDGNTVEVAHYLANCQGLLLLIDPIRERDLGDTHRYLHRTLLRVAQRVETTPGQRLPHYVAVCLTKFDDPSVFRFARDNGFPSYRENDPMMFPQIPDSEAERFMRELFSGSVASDFELVVGALRQYFDPERVRYFVTSAVGFYLGRSGVFRQDDIQNVVPLEDGTFAIRGQIHPINVAEPLLWLGDRIAAEN